MASLHIVRKFFPEVTTVEDAKEPIQVEVTKLDNRSAKVKNHKACAMAVACKRMTKADGVIVSVKTAYVIYGKKAVRYRLRESVTREVVSFDRDAGFSPGIYTMTPFNTANKLGAIRGGNAPATGKKKQTFVHHTEGIRTVLGSEVV